MQIGDVIEVIKLKGHEEEEKKRFSGTVVNMYQRYFTIDTGLYKTAVNHSDIKMKLLKIKILRRAEKMSLLEITDQEATKPAAPTRITKAKVLELKQEGKTLDAIKDLLLIDVPKEKKNPLGAKIALFYYEKKYDQSRKKRTKKVEPEMVVTLSEVVTEKDLDPVSNPLASGSCEATKDDYLGTYTGKCFWIKNPKPEDICLEDIAHALSNICRFNGHTKRFYSVAEHCLNIATFLYDKGHTNTIQLYGILHDAAEAYVCDIPRPLKKFLPGYQEIEAGAMDAIYRSFGLVSPSNETKQIIDQADNYILAIEARDLMEDVTDWDLTKVQPTDRLYKWGDVCKTYGIYLQFMQANFVRLGGI